MSKHICKIYALLLSAALVLSFVLCSCKKSEKSTYEILCGAKQQFSQYLTNVSVYDSNAEPGEAEHIDQGLIAALLGDGSEYPPQMSGCQDYSFFCASSIEVCELWIVRCRTYSCAQSVYELFEERRNRLSKTDFENDADSLAADSAEIIKKGKTVCFAALSCSKQALDHICGEI